MKKAFWITLGLFILSLIIFIFKWDVVQEHQTILGGFFFILFIAIALMAKYFYVTIIFGGIFIFGLVKFIKHTDNDILKTLVVSFFMLITGICLIFAIMILFQKPYKEEVIDDFGGVDKMLSYAEQFMFEENPNIDFELVEKGLETNEENYDYDGDVEYPVMKYNYDVAFKDVDNTIYNGDLDVVVICSSSDHCFIYSYKFENLQTENGQPYNKGKATEEEAYERSNNDDFSFWEMDPYYEWYDN